MNKLALIPTLLLLLISIALPNPAQGQSPTSGTVSRNESRSSRRGTAEAAIPANADQLEFNFHNVPLDTVLTYMSKAAGFVIIKNADVSGSVNVLSHQPLKRDEAVELLNTVLNEKGYAAIRNGRTLTIVARDEARQRNIPVKVGSDPASMPSSDEMVTQIIPVRHANAGELIDSIKELLPSYATVSANTSSNALVLTDTQTGIKRIAEIVKALDQSISSISELKVFRLTFADAKETATLIESLFPQQQTSSRGGNSPIEEMMARFRGGGPGGDSNSRSSRSSSGDSVALRAASRVTAEADERTNSVVVAAPEELMPTVEKLIQSIDKSADIDTVVRVFTLQFSDATEMAATITSIFGEGGQTGRTQGNSSRFGGFPFMRSEGSSRGSSNNAALSQRMTAEKTVLAVADTRTNSIIVSAVAEVMEQVAGVVASLDQNPAKAKRVYTYSLRNADPEQVTTMLQQMFAAENTNTRSTRSTRQNTQARGTSSNQRNLNNLNNNSNNNGRSGNSGLGSNSGR
mgnify:CR=1 FL=1